MKKTRLDYRHVLCLFLTITFCFMTFYYFSGSITRLVESFRDLGLSCAYWFCSVFEIDFSFSVTVTGVSNFTPKIFLPETWELFAEKWAMYWQVFATEDALFSYLEYLGNLLADLSKFLVLAMPLFLIVFLIIRRISKIQNNDYNADTKPLKLFKNFIEKPYLAVKNWVISFFSFVKEHKFYIVIWVIILAICFNVITILIEFFAFYFYFVFSFDVANLYIQVYKLIGDLYTPIKTLGVIGVSIIAYIVLDKIRRSIGLNSLNRFEDKNKDFIKNRPISMMIVGTMGKQKTTALTDMVLSVCVMHRDKALEKLIENDLKFPNFPWINLENVLKIAMDKHIVFNLATTRKFIRTLKGFYYISKDKPERKKYLKRHIRRKFGFFFENYLFDYDYKKYGLTYDDKLKLVDIWEVIETYAQLYFIYVIESSFILSNYSIRTDNNIQSIGNFPLWDNDFFQTNSKEIDKLSRHAHILDFDSLRLGKKVIDKNNDFSFEFGVVAITEIGKERGNKVENEGIKKRDDEANQKNDLFNDWLKMIRHSATVDNYPFVKVITDDQRATSWGADARELCDIVAIEEARETRLAMPFFAFGELFYYLVFNKFYDKYLNYRFNRGDNSLYMYLYKGVVSKVQHFYSGIYNQFGYHALDVQTESGTLDGAIVKDKYYIMNKKIYSKRFSTDCFSDFFSDKSVKAQLGLNDVPEYETEKASFEELKQQNSYFIRNLVGIKEKNN